MKEIETFVYLRERERVFSNCFIAPFNVKWSEAFHGSVRLCPPCNGLLQLCLQGDILFEWRYVYIICKSYIALIYIENAFACDLEHLELNKIYRIDDIADKVHNFTNNLLWLFNKHAPFFTRKFSKSRRLGWLITSGYSWN